MEIIPIMFAIIIIFSGLDIPGLTLPVLMILAWNSAVNPWSIILLVGPFRREIRNLFIKKILRKNILAISVVEAPRNRKTSIQMSFVKKNTIEPRNSTNQMIIPI